MGEKPTEVTPGAWNDPGTPAAPGETRVEADESPEPGQIRAEIQQTRAEMSETIDAIQEKLSPQRVMEQARETVRDATVGRIERPLDDAPAR